MKIEHLKWLENTKACSQSIKWIEENNIQSLEEAWTSCDRGDWLLWMAQKLGIDSRKLVLCGAVSAWAAKYSTDTGWAATPDMKANQIRATEIVRENFTEDVMNAIRAIR